MFDMFSEAARRSTFFARFEAGRLGFDDIDTPHVLLGFIDVDSGTEDARELFASDTHTGNSAISKIQRTPHIPFPNADTANRLRTMFSHSGPRLASLPTNADMPLTTRARRVLNYAFEHAAGGSVTPLHLLWAMLGEDQDDVANTIKQFGVTREQIDNEIRRNVS